MAQQQMQLLSNWFLWEVFADSCLENVSIWTEKSIKYQKFPLFDNFSDCKTFCYLDGLKIPDTLSSYAARFLKEKFVVF